MTTIRRIALWLVLGPITGLLAEGVYRNGRAGNSGQAWLCAVATMFCSFDLAAYGGGAPLTPNR